MPRAGILLGSEGDSGKVLSTSMVSQARRQMHAMCVVPWNTKKGTGLSYTAMLADW